MKVILLEKIRKLGSIGAVVFVKDGYARNLLLPHKYAASFNMPAINPNNEINHNIDHTYRIPAFLLYMRAAKDNGDLFDFVRDSDILFLLRKFNVFVWRDQIYMPTVFKTLGEHYVKLIISNQVVVKICIKILRKNTS